MKKYVTLNEELIKKYYKDLFFKFNIYILIFVILLGASASIIYIMDENWLAGIAIEILTIFFSSFIIMANRKNMKIAIASLYESYKTYEFIFLDDEFKVSSKKDTKEYKYISIKTLNLKHFYQIRTMDKKIYILEKDCFTKEEWDEIRMRIKISKKEKK